MRGRVASARRETTPQSATANSSPYTGELAATEASPPKGRWLGAAETEGWRQHARGNPSVRYSGQLPLHRGAEWGTPRLKSPLPKGSLFFFLGMVIQRAFLV